MFRVLKKLFIGLVVLIGLFFVFEIAMIIHFSSFDYDLITSRETISGLIYTNVYVSGKDIPTGPTKVCTGAFSAGISVSHYTDEELKAYKESGDWEDQQKPQYEVGLDPYSCKTIDLKKNQVVEGFNRNWGSVDYYLKKVKDK